jgi:nitrous oxidase accessory protein NosD
MSVRFTMLMGLWAVSASSAVLAATLRVPQQYGSIQAGVDAAMPGDTVLVGPGIYIENVLIQKSLKLRSTDGAALTTIDGNGIGAPLAAWGTLTEDVTISGFTLTGGAFLLDSVEVGYPNQWGAGLFIDSVSSANVFGNVVSGNRGCGGSGIRTFESNIRIHDNVVRENQPMDWCPGNGEALRLNGSGTLTESKTALVDRNEIVGNGGVGLSLVAFADVSVRGNVITDNGNTLEPLPIGGGLELGHVGGVVADNYVARNFGYDATGLKLSNFNDPPFRLFVTGNRFVDNLSIGSVGAVWLTTYSPSQTYFFANRVVGESSGVLMFCDGGAVTAFGNLVVNRDPSGTASQCVPAFR